jgi:hypothetical protein
MKRLSGPVLLLAAAVLLPGCSSFGKMFGGTDDTVLPGTREDAIPGHSQFPEPGDTGGVDTATTQDQGAAPAPDTAATASVDCTNPKNKKDPSCADMSASDGTFSDGQ